MSLGVSTTSNSDSQNASLQVNERLSLKSVGRKNQLTVNVTDEQQWVPDDVPDDDQKAI